MKPIILSLIITLFLTSCNKERDPFLIEKHNIGLLTDSTQVKDLKSIFENDSVAQNKGDAQFKIIRNSIEIFDTSGQPLLILTPTKTNDSTATIKSIRVMDSRYKTEGGISTLSTFKDIQDNYSISKINNLINSLLITVNEIDADFTIDKKELPANLRFDMNLNIEASQIPDNAKIKYFFINWN